MKTFSVKPIIILQDFQVFTVIRKGACLGKKVVEFKQGIKDMQTTTILIKSPTHFCSVVLSHFVQLGAKPGNLFLQVPVLLFLPGDLSQQLVVGALQAVKEWEAGQTMT